ncbi:MAG: Fic family protein [Patescibacteria group bacterium]|nr:Fic family protein [Patescibacteria group bacterium]MDE1945503.1 Fic family protein [Patescibacteria group bacterium]MDE2057623.1 Fic family protein [Patescibacteria group bacterium]
MPDRYDTNPSEGELLPNRLGLTDPGEINKEEAIGFLRAEQAAIDTLAADTLFSLDYLYTLHRDALGHLYDFAGRLRTVNLSKGGFLFAAANVLPAVMREFGREYLEPLASPGLEDDAALLDHLAALHAELLHIHPFREGNGRVIRLFTKLIFLAKTGEELDFELLTREGNFDRYVTAVQQAVNKDYRLMRELFREMNA